MYLQRDCDSFESQTAPLSLSGRVWVCVCGCTLEVVHSEKPKHYSLLCTVPRRFMLKTAREKERRGLCWGRGQHNFVGGMRRRYAEQKGDKLVVCVRVWDRGLLVLMLCRVSALYLKEKHTLKIGSVLSKQCFFISGSFLLFCYVLFFHFLTVNWPNIHRRQQTAHVQRRVDILSGVVDTSDNTWFEW